MPQRWYIPIFSPLGPKMKDKFTFEPKKSVLRYKALKMWLPMYWDRKCEIELLIISAVVGFF